MELKCQRSEKLVSHRRLITSGLNLSKTFSLNKDAAKINSKQQQQQQRKVTETAATSLDLQLQQHNNLTCCGLKPSTGQTGAQQATRQPHPVKEQKHLSILQTPPTPPPVSWSVAVVAPPTGLFCKFIFMHISWSEGTQRGWTVDCMDPTLCSRLWPLSTVPLPHGCQMDPSGTSPNPLTLA